MPQRNIKYPQLKNRGMRKNRAKIAFAITIMSIMLTVVSCSKIGNLLTFRVGMQTKSFDFTIPITTDTAVAIGPVATTFNVDSFIRANTAGQMGSANIKSVKLSSVVLTLNNANAANNFQNFEFVDLAFSSNTNGTPYTMSIANNPDSYSSTLSLPVDTTRDLSSYLGNEFTYTVRGRLRKPTTQEVNCTAVVTFNLLVKG